jgi:hypothetical protein
VSYDPQRWAEDARQRVDDAENAGRVRSSDAEYLRAIIVRYENPDHSSHTQALTQHWGDELARAGVDLPDLERSQLEDRL